MGANTKLSDLFRIGSSKRVLKSQWQESGVPFYRGREVTRLSQYGFVDNDLFITEELYSEYADKYGVPTTGDIVITAIGTIGNSYIVKDGDRFYFKDASVLWLNRKSDVISEYINFWLKSSLMKDQLDKGNGATVDTLTIKKLQACTVRLPSLPEQKHIVAILDQAFSYIEQARTKTEQNLKNARELFESYLDSYFNPAKSHKWKRIKIEDACTSIIDCINKTAPKVDYATEYKMIRTTNVRHGLVSLEKVNYVTKETFSQWTRRQVPQLGDVILTREAPMGEVGMLLSNEHVFLGQRLVSYRANPEFLNRHFLLFSFQSKDVQEQIASRASGSTVQHMRVPDTKILEIPLPSLQEQELIVEKLESAKEKTSTLVEIYTSKLDALDELKKSILQKAFSGELTKTSDNDASKGAAA
jgi:type I restriction enzyme S subunit